MSNIYDSYIDSHRQAVSYDDRCLIVFDNEQNLVGRTDRIFVDEKKNTNFVFSFSFGTRALYYFGIKPLEIIINNESNKMIIESDAFFISSIDVDRTNNRYVMTVEAKNEKYTRN